MADKLYVGERRKKRVLCVGKLKNIKGIKMAEEQQMGGGALKGMGFTRKKVSLRN